MRAKNGSERQKKENKVPTAIVLRKILLPAYQLYRKRKNR